MNACRIAICCLLALACLPGCDNLSSVFGNPKDRALAKSDAVNIDPFDIGPASKWQTPGLYLDYAHSNKVALVSDHDMLVALLLINPDTGNVVQYDRLSSLFKDPQDGSMYTRDGLLWGDSPGKYSLPRCRIRHLGSLDDPDVGLQVDPSKRFYHEDQQWSKAASNHLYIDLSE